MATAHENKTPDSDPADNLEALSREFNGASFYGLEYVVDDLFQDQPTKLPVSVQPTVDWFGLYD